MIDQDIPSVSAGKAQALWRWIGEAARDIDHTARVLHRIQYDRPWERVANGDDGRRRAAPKRRDAQS